MNAFVTALLVLIGILLAAGGIWLIALGGSWYYVLAGPLFLVSAVLVRRRNPAALIVYAVLVLGSLGWAVAEIGFDWWQLAPRGGLIVLLGLLLLVPWWRRGPEGPGQLRWVGGAGGWRSPRRCR